MSKLKKEELLEHLEFMYTCVQGGANQFGKEVYPPITQAYKQIKALIQKPRVTEEFIEEKATELYNYLYYETFSLDQVKDFVRSLFGGIRGK